MSDIRPIDFQADAGILEDIRALVDYNWQDEQRDFEEHHDDDDEQASHVFNTLVRIDTWLGEQGV